LPSSSFEDENGERRFFGESGGDGETSYRPESDGEAGGERERLALFLHARQTKGER
jgi:hypothetical protein